MTEQQKSEIRECFKRKDIFHVFIENHLKQYPEERINTGGLTEEIEPLSAMKLHAMLEHITKQVENNYFEMDDILLDILETSKEIINDKA